MHLFDDKSEREGLMTIDMFSGTPLFSNAFNSSKGFAD